MSIHNDGDFPKAIFDLLAVALFGKSAGKEYIGSAI